MERFVLSLLCLLNFILFGNASDYDDPNAQMEVNLGSSGVISTSTTSSPSDGGNGTEKEIKDKWNEFEDFLSSSMPYSAIAGGVILLCCLCVCCRVHKRRKAKRQPTTGQYSYYTQV